MMINEKKSKTILFNFTDNYQFMTRLKINDKPIEVINNTKLLGSIISNDLSWDLNTANIVKKANGRMELLRKVASFTTNQEELKNIFFIFFIRSLLEQSAPVWHSSLTDENVSDLERVQKTAVKLILGERYLEYDRALRKLDLESLHERRETLCLVFAKKSSRNAKSRSMFPKNEKMHPMDIKNPEVIKVQHANTESFNNLYAKLVK